ncbi:hypothetical protein C8R41DRAFT_924021 [Lentinula lateritia]|uniref:Uncharacterized protein n=1 Tax=Lentinula lateritia TaxID=40482 RepID=A0ABQ8V4G5_9AGAR|nr:hypothetical protein C8R41DRAFT_924021 [Lentinula lateritia]
MATDGLNPRSSQTTMVNKNTPKPKNVYFLLAPPGNQPRAGLYSSMQFRRNGLNTPPLPIPVQTNSKAQAMAFLALQPWVASQHTLPPSRFMDEFLNSQLFRTVEAQIGQMPDGLFWFVSHGERAGIYLNSREALSSVDNERSGRYQRAFAFRSLTHAFRALIDNEDVPLGLIYDYDPNRNPVEARNIRGTVLHSGDSESHAPDPPQNTVPSSPPVLRSSIPPPTIPSTPRRGHRTSTLEAMAGTPPHRLGSPGFIIYSPNASFNFSQDTNASPSVGRRHTEPEPEPEVKQETKEKGKGKREESTTPVLPGVERGRQLLRVTQWTPVDIERVEELLMLADDREDFAYRLNDEYSGSVSFNMCLYIWDVYHDTFSADL